MTTWPAPPCDQPPALELLEERFALLAAAHDALELAALERVTTWRWATNDCHDPRPLYYERHGFTRGRMLSGLPAPVCDHRQYGFDAQGRVVVERQLTAANAPSTALPACEVFTFWHESAVEQMRFGVVTGAAHPSAYHHGLVCDGRLAVWSCRAVFCVEREHYRWDASGRLARIDVARTDLERGPVAEPQPFQRIVPGYDDQGRLAEVAVHWLPFDDRTRTTTHVPWKRRRRSAEHAA